MSQNPNGEYRIPAGDHNPESQTPIYDELKTIYQNQGENNKTPVYFQSQSERAVNPISDRLYFIADEIVKERQKKLTLQFTHHAKNETNFIVDIAKHLFNRSLSPRYLKPLTENDLKTQESEIGAKIFGQNDKSIRRKFWNDDRENWYYHQEITDAAGNIDDTTLHYEVGTVGILRISSKKDTPNEFVHGKELENLISATEIYHNRVLSQIYSDNNPTNNRLAA